MKWGSAVLALVTTSGVVASNSGCGKADAQLCRRSGQTQYCLVEKNGGYEATGSGFKPGSDVRQSVDGEPGQVMRADANGSIPEPGAAVGVLKGPDDQRLTVTGTNAGGGEIRFEFTVPASR